MLAYVAVGCLLTGFVAIFSSRNWQGPVFFFLAATALSLLQIWIT